MIDGVEIISKINLIIFLAFIFTFLSCVLSSILIYKHLKHYTQPKIQRLIVRILLFVPIYGIDSLISLIWINSSLYWDLIRDCYEAYILYCFFSLLINYLNSETDIELGKNYELGEFSEEVEMKEEEEGNNDKKEDKYQFKNPLKEYSKEYENNVIILLESKPKLKLSLPFCCLPYKYQPNRNFLIWTKRSILQFTILKPVLAIIAIILELFDKYGDGEFLNFEKGYIYLIVIENISITLAMYFLVMFYEALKEDLKKYNVLSKFLCIKSIILFIFWQGIIIGCLFYFKVLFIDEEKNKNNRYTERNTSIFIQDFLITFEIFIISIIHHYSFSYKTYVETDTNFSCRDFIPCYEIFCCCCCCFSICRNFFHSINQTDVIEEVKVFKINDNDIENIQSIKKKSSNILFNKFSSQLNNKEEQIEEEYDSDEL
eukprot:TRINITY_DN15193_c0_g1_i1.p1 TRINITY_DN15193_c0_g1~~TRINITY_DN15193_c0_g1_i1.p1  ORF type:complete len:430 (-),score=51.84 TRINITY_DN15193_c0_g1_i1:50-1339(-)